MLSQSPTSSGAKEGRLAGLGKADVGTATTAASNPAPATTAHAKSYREQKPRFAQWTTPCAFAATSLSSASATSSTLEGLPT